MVVTMEGQRRTAVSLMQVAVAVLVAVCCVNETSAFNVDVENVVQYSGRDSDSMFGFSVAMFKESRESWVLVGAPEAQSQVQREVRRGGAVYRCSTTRGVCDEVSFDQTGNMQNSTHFDMDNKSNQWFGATISVAASGSAVVACAPRYVYYPQIREERHEPVGTCWVARDNLRSFSEYSPCRTSEWGYHRKGVCQAGFSASMSDDGRRLFMGAPGSHYWQGLLFSVDATVFMPFLPPESIRVNITSGQLYVLNVHNKPDVLQTKQGEFRDDDTYLGYSVAVGKFHGLENTTVAVGRPKGHELKGMVEFYSSNVVLFDEIYGTQLGSYFGYSLCASDMDGDGLDDIVVGAPLYTERNNERKYETGRVYVFFQKNYYHYSNVSDGVNSRSRFGLSVCSLGDINKDGFGDIAVGAPYDHYENKAEGYGQGAVYIYLGSSSGMKDKPSQIIYAKDVAPSLSTFGFSVSGGQDLDNNEYPDLVVGAYEANAAAFFRARPIVKVDASIQYNITSKQVNLKNFNCYVEREPTTCASVKMCLQFSGVGVEEWHAFIVQITLDSARPGSPRMFFRDTRPTSSRNITFSAVKDRMYCQNFEVYIKPNIRDKLSALEVEMRYSLNSTRNVGRYARLAPVLDLFHPPVTKDSLHIIKHCGPDNVCIPDLKMKVTESVKQYLLGSGENFNLTILVDNRGEDAFESTFTLHIPKGLNYINIKRLDSNKDVTVQCSPPSPTAVNKTLLCDIGNPLPNKTHVEFKILMEPRYEEGLHSRYNFSMNVNSTNPEKPGTTKDNTKELGVPISIKSEISLSGGSKPSDVFWNSMDYAINEEFKEESEIGPVVVHEHRIRNDGPADIIEADVFLVVPTSTFAGENLLYILDQPATTGPIQCDTVPEANYLSLKLDQKGSDERGVAGSAEQSISQISSSGSFSSSSSSTHNGNFAEGQGSRTGNSGSTHNRGHIQKVVGTDDERIMRKEEGPERTRYGHSNAGYDQSGSGYEQSGSRHQQHSFQNSSQSSWRTETIHGGSGPVVHSSHNISASWSEDGGPVHHYENSTSGSNVHISSGVAHHNGRGDHSGSFEHHDTSGRRTEGRVGEHSETSSSTHQLSHSETTQSGRGFSANIGGHQGSNTIHHGTNTAATDNYDEEEETEYGDSYEEEDNTDPSTGGGYYGSTGGARGSSVPTQNSSHHSSSGGSYSTQWTSQGSAGSRTNVGSHDNAGSRDNVGSHDNAGSHASAGSRDNVYGSQDNTRGYYGGSGRNDGTSVTYDSSDRRQGQNSSRGGFQHWASWSASGGSQQGSGHRNKWDASGSTAGRDNVNEDKRYGYSGSDHVGRDNVGRDNVDDDRRHGGSYGYSSHESRVRTQHYGDGDNDGRTISHHSSPSNVHHYSSSSRTQSSSSSHSQNQDPQGGHGEDVYRQYYSSNWDSDGQDNREVDHYNSRAGSRRDQIVKEGQRWDESRTGEGRGGSGHFYTSSVLIDDGNQDLGYAARGYGQPHDSLASLAARQRSSGGQRSTTLDPDLSDLGSTFTDGPKSQNYDSRDRDSESSLKLHNRYRRSTVNSLEELIKCNVTNCTRIYCKLGLLTKEKEAHVTLRMRAWVPTMKKYNDDRVIKTSSRMALRVTKLPYIGKPEKEIIKDHEVFTNIISTDSPTVPDIVPLWVVVLSAVAGTIILLLLIFLLYKCGFFKRNRPTDSAEKEPLNRNGHYSAGDEAL